MFTLESGFKKLQIRMLDSPDTCGRKLYPEKPVPGSQIVGRARKSGDRRKCERRAKSGAEREERKFLPFFFEFATFSISRTRLSRSLEQAISGKKNVRIQKYPDTCDGASGS